MGAAIFEIFIFPGFLFLGGLGLAAEWVDRKLYARFQNRIGPPWFQPLADLIKLFAKESVIPDEADKRVFTLAPVFALACSVTSFLYIPLWAPVAAYSMSGDLIVVLYLLTIPTLTFFLGGWYSRSVFSTLGAVRAITQLFAYEIPFFVSILAAALLANSWSLAGIAGFVHVHPWRWLVNIPGFLVALVSLLGKLERVPFDIPDAETEIVAGCMTEYSGRLLGFFRIGLDVETVVGASLLAAVFFPFGLGFAPIAAFLVYLAKVAVIVAILALLRTLFARLRIDQMIDFCWKYLAPIAFVQVLLNLTLKGVLQ